MILTVEEATEEAVTMLFGAPNDDELSLVRFAARVDDINKLLKRAIQTGKIRPRNQTTGRFDDSLAFMGNQAFISLDDAIEFLRGEGITPRKAAHSGAPGQADYSNYRHALAAIVKITAPDATQDARRSMAGKLATASNGEVIENLAFTYQNIGLLFHPDAPAAAADLAKQLRNARESGELQSLIPLADGGILATDLLAWPECPPVLENNPLSYWLPAHSGTQECNEVSPSRPMPAQRFQEQEILRVIGELKHNPKKLPKDTPGKKGIKHAVRTRLRFTPAVFDKAWERLTNEGEIIKQK